VAAVRLDNQPINGTAARCCARATTVHAAALPSPATNSRRRILDPPADRASLSPSRLSGNRLGLGSNTGLGSNRAGLAGAVSCLRGSPVAGTLACLQAA
jgi:hypothetical protein